MIKIGCVEEGLEMKTSGMFDIQSTDGEIWHFRGITGLGTAQSVTDNGFVMERNSLEEGRINLELKPQGCETNFF